MYGFLLAALVLDGLFLATVILLQAGKGGGLAAVGGSGGTMADGVLGGRQATTVLTRATWTAGAIFMSLALVLSILSSRARAPESVIQVNAPAATAPVPVLPGVAEQPTAVGDGNTDGNARNEGN
ncbi:MAG: preprotein translocase subunit SecG [Longimicrobiales bacterium]|nr:preprotein translocase subunit SecG [Longimicrobiales bacterium]